MTQILRLFCYLTASVLVAWPCAATADTWSFDPVRKDTSYKFGATEIVLTVDGTKSRTWPEFEMRVYDKGQLQAQVRNIKFEQVFASPDQTTFVGLSNLGIPGTAIVVFDRRGAIRLLVNHGLAAFDYCEKSVTMLRRWYDEEKPNVQFNQGKSRSITLRDCRGRTVDLVEVALDAYQRSAEEIRREKAAPRP